jgi:beta-glucosidase/6-phospho-beta-glucosidase/beta-galactosidase
MSSPSRRFALALVGAFALAAVPLLHCSSSSGPKATPDAGNPPAPDGGSDAGSDADAGPPLPSVVTFPAGFMWGAATAAFQVEKGDSNTDWAAWANTSGKIKNGDNPDVGGDDALAHIDDDIALMTSEGHNAYRFSLEWSRLYPTEAAFLADQPDPAAVTAYDTLIQKLVAAHVTPLVTLNHFALPNWLDDITQSSQPQGWERPTTSDEFVTFCTRMGTRWGKNVDWWITVNEPINLVLGGYVQGSFPPGIVLDFDRAFAVARAEARAHARCYDALHAADTVDADGDGKAAMVSYAAHMRTFHPYYPDDPNDQAAAERVRYIANDWFLNAVVKGNWDNDFTDVDGKYTGPNDVVADPTLKGRLDYIGVNYYSDTIISASYGLVLPVINASIIQAGLPTPRPKTDFDWDIYPAGFGTVLDEAAGYGLPLVVTENGVADQKDVMRGRFIAEHLLELGAANLRGDNVLGYFHWSLLDNFEWANGFCPKFGLHSVDPSTAARTPRASASLYSSIIHAGKVTQAQIDALPPYGAPTMCQ